MASHTGRRPAATGLSRNRWYKSRRSDPNQDCLEAVLHERGVLVRDSTRPESAVLGFPPREWAALTRAARTRTR